MKPGDKPWLISIVYPGKLHEIASDKWWHSTYVMKTLYFMQRDMSDLANYAWLDTHEEFLREAFENDGLPQTVFIKDGKPYYVPWHAIGINKF